MAPFERIPVAPQVVLIQLAQQFPALLGQRLFQRTVVTRAPARSPSRNVHSPANSS